MTPEHARRWRDAVEVRRSRRAYDDGEPDPGDLAALHALAASFRPYPDARVVVVTRPPADLFLGIVGSYGRVTGAPAALLFVGGRSVAAHHHVGYTGEAVVLEAAALGLDTCWVGGMFRGGVAGDLARPGAGERVYAVSPVGHALARRPLTERLVHGPGGPKHRLGLETIAPGAEATWPVWALEGARAVQLAPSAMHRQPWRLRLERDGVVVAVDGPSTPLVTKRLDCGIAMLHFEVGARAAGADGTWEDLGRGRDVARWRPRG